MVVVVLRVRVVSWEWEGRSGKDAAWLVEKGSGDGWVGGFGLTRTGKVKLGKG